LRQSAGANSPHPKLAGGNPSLDSRLPATAAVWQARQAVPVVSSVLDFPAEPVDPNVTIRQFMTPLPRLAAS
jgi:hypothetical protein